MSERSDIKKLPVVLLFYIKDKSFQRVIEQNVDFLTEAYNVFGNPKETFDFKYFFVETIPYLATALLELIHMDRCSSLIMISDQLLEKEEQVKISQLGKIVRGAFFASNRASNLIALSKQHKDYRDAFLSVCPFHQFDIPQLRQEIVDSATRLSLFVAPHFKNTSKIKTSSQELNKPNFRIQEVSSKDQFMECLRLRYKVQSILGYPNTVIKNQEIEIDYHDGTALHYAAIDNSNGKIAGNLRLIIPHQPWGMIESSGRSLKETFLAQQAWFKSISQEIPESDVRQRLMDAGAAPLPMLKNIRMNERWRPLILKAFSGAEISRVIVNPEYRGSGISRVLLHQAVVTASDLKREAIFAECFPNHTPMYEKYGFEKIEERPPVSEGADWLGFYPQSLILKLLQKEPILTKWDFILFKLAQSNMEALRENIEKETIQPKQKKAGGK